MDEKCVLCGHVLFGPYLRKDGGAICGECVKDAGEIWNEFCGVWLEGALKVRQCLGFTGPYGQSNQ